MVMLIAKHFPKVSQKYLMEVLLPEALITLCCHQLKITDNQAEDLLRSGGKREADAFMQRIEQKKNEKKILEKETGPKKKNASSRRS